MAAAYARGSGEKQWESEKTTQLEVAEWVCGVNSMKVAPRRSSVAFFPQMLAINAAVSCFPFKLGGPACGSQPIK